MARPSGRFVLRIAPVLHEALRREAARRDCSLNELCAELLRRGLGGDPAEGFAPALARGPVPPEVIAGIRRALRGQLEGLVLFGSAARGELWETSDVDLLAVLRPGVSPARRFYALWDAEVVPPEAPLSRRISPHFVALPQGPEAAGGLWFEVALDGVILWDSRWRIAGLLSRLRREIAEGAVARKLVHGQPCWMRLPKTA